MNKVIIVLLPINVGTLAKYEYYIPEFSVFHIQSQLISAKTVGTS